MQLLVEDPETAKQFLSHDYTTVHKFETQDKNSDMDYTPSLQPRPDRQRPQTAPRFRTNGILDERTATIYSQKPSLATISVKGGQKSFVKMQLDKELAKSNRKGELAYMWKQESELKKLETAYLN